MSNDARKLQIAGKFSSLPEGGGPNQQLVTDADGVAKWEDRTHYALDSVQITWDGETANREFCKIITDGEDVTDAITYKLYKVSDIVLSAEQLGLNSDAPAIFKSSLEESREVNTRYITIVANITFFVPSPAGVAICSGKEGTYEPNGDGMILTIPSSGTYFAVFDATEYISLLITSPVVKPIDPKYLPEEVPAPSTAQVGQTIAVKSVDDSGKPTEWETKDYLPLTGGTLTDDLNIGSTDSTDDAQLRIAKQGSDSKGYQMGSYISGGNMARTDYIADGSIANFMQLGPTETGFGKPVRVSSGGTGVTSLEELKTKLGIGESSGLPEGATAHQQLVTDAEGMAKWEERTHYRDISERSICENVTLAFSENPDMGGLYMAQYAVDFCPGAYDAVRVIWDGVEYVCQSVDDKYGNGAIVNPGFADTGEPFVMGFDGAGHAAGVLTCIAQDSTIPNHNVSVIVVATTCVPLPLEYVPTDEIPSMTSLYIAIGTTTTTEYQEMLNKFNNKKIIEFIVRAADGGDRFLVCNGFESVLDKYIDGGSHEVTGAVSYISKKGITHKTWIERLIFYFEDGVVSAFSTQYPTAIYLYSAEAHKEYAISVNGSGILTATEVTE